MTREASTALRQINEAATKLHQLADAIGCGGLIQRGLRRSRAHNFHFAGETSVMTTFKSLSLCASVILATAGGAVRFRAGNRTIPRSRWT